MRLIKNHYFYYLLVEKAEATRERNGTDCFLDQKCEISNQIYHRLFWGDRKYVFCSDFEDSFDNLLFNAKKSDVRAKNRSSREENKPYIELMSACSRQVLFNFSSKSLAELAIFRPNKPFVLDQVFMSSFDIVTYALYNYDEYKTSNKTITFELRNLLGFDVELFVQKGTKLLPKIDDICENIANVNVYSFKLSLFDFYFRGRRLRENQCSERFFSNITKHIFSKCFFNRVDLFT